MERTAHRHKHLHRNNDYDLSADLERIKAALADASYDVKGKAGEIFNESLENVKQRSSDLQDNMANYVSEKPLKSLSFALISGLILGFLLHKK